MKTRPMLVCLLAASRAGPMLVLAGEPEADSSRATPQYVKDSPITAAVKTRLAAADHGSIANLKVDADQEGIVWLSGSTPSQETADRAVETARNADGVVAVKSTIVVERGTK